nr:radical SAM protein [Clostridia bacterium]
MSVNKTIAKLGLSRAFNALYHDPDTNLNKLIDWADKFDKDSLYSSQRAAIRKAINDPEYPYYPFVRHVLNDINPGVMKTIATNFMINANLLSGPIQEELRAKYNCNIPWAILLDPTTACNLHCTGCWAADYEKNINLSFDEMDDIICQGKKIGIYFYLFSGGEPLVRKKDIIRLCEKHDDCMFTAFTNGTLIDESFAKEMLRVKNFAPAISLEGFDEATDARRGKGVYSQVLKAMKILHDNKLVYGISCCYTSENYDDITSEAYWDMMIKNGAFFVWYFHYMPVGNDASPILLLTPNQRELVYHRIRHYRSTKPLFAIDFQNDGEYINGCIAGGRRYMHINANGDAEPCAFIHFADSNIRNKSLLDILRSPLFKAYHDNQPFNENMLQPCPMLENPNKLRKIIKDTKARSTDMHSPETVDHLCSKCDNYALHWSFKARDIWEKGKGI